METSETEEISETVQTIETLGTRVTMETSISGHRRTFFNFHTTSHLLSLCTFTQGLIPIGGYLVHKSHEQQME